MGRLRLRTSAPSIEVAHDVQVIDRPGNEQSVKPSDEKGEKHPILPRRTKDNELPAISPEDVKRRHGEDGERLFIVVDGIVLDCTSYIHRHPGGASIIQGFGGQDCSWQWWTFHNRRVWNDILLTLRVGKTEGVENHHNRPSRAFVGLMGFGYQEEFS